MKQSIRFEMSMILSAFQTYLGHRSYEVFVVPSLGSGKGVHYMKFAAINTLRIKALRRHRKNAVPIREKSLNGIVSFQFRFTALYLNIQ